MRISRMTVDARPNDRGGTLARFTAELTPDITIHSLRLRRNASGKFRVHAANVDGVNVADFAPDLARELTDLAVAAYNETTGANADADRRHRFTA